MVNYNNLQKKIQKTMYLEGKINRNSFKKVNLKEFIKNFVNSAYKQTTVRLHKNRKIEKEEKTRRSVGDIFNVCKYYYPDTTLKQVQTILYELIKDKKITAFYCNDIKRRVYCSSGFGVGSLYSGYGLSKDEHGINQNELEKLVSE